MNGAARPVRYFADNMSDGTLHALGVLLALFQSPGGAGGTRVVGIEEPETALHPDAAGVLADALLDASQRVQVIVTNHSADLLDRESVPVDSILPMVAADGESKIGPLDEVGRSVLRDGTSRRANCSVSINSIRPLSSQPGNVSTYFAGLELGVHSSDCRRRRGSAGGTGAACEVRV